MDLLGRGMVPPGWGMAGVRDWKRRDWEVMEGMLRGYLAPGGNGGGQQQQGLRGGGGGGGGEFPWAEMMFANGGGMHGMQGYGGAGPMGFQQQQQQQPSAWGPGPGLSPWQSNPYHNGGNNYGFNLNSANNNMNPWQSGVSGGPDFKRDIHSPVDDPRFTGMDEKLRILTDIMFGSEAERQEKQVQEQLLKRFQPMIPELAKLIALQQQQQAGGAAAGAAAGGLPGMGGGGPGMSPFAAGPAGMMPPPPGMGMGGGPMLNPYAAMGGGMGPMMGGGGGDPGTMGGGGGGGDMGGGGGPGRRRNQRGRRPIRDYDYDEEEEDDYGGFGSRVRGGRMRRRGGGRTRRDGDLFDDWAGDGEYVKPGGWSVIGSRFN